MAQILAWLDKVFGSNWKRKAFGVGAAIIVVLSGLSNALHLAWAGSAVAWILTATTFLGVGQVGDMSLPQIAASTGTFIVALVALVQPFIRSVVIPLWQGFMQQPPAAPPAASTPTR